MNDKRLKQIKLYHLVMIFGGDVFTETLTTLYTGEKPIEENLLKVAEVKSNGFNSDEKTFLLNLKEGKRDIKKMDISLSFKLIQLTCGLEPKVTSSNNSCVWSKRCPVEKQDCLEQLLYKYKMERNNLVHELSSLGNISDEEFKKRKEHNMEHLSAILRKVGEKIQLSDNEIKLKINMLKFKSHTFCEKIGIIGIPRFIECSAKYDDNSANSDTSDDEYFYEKLSDIPINKLTNSETNDETSSLRLKDEQIYIDPGYLTPEEAFLEGYFEDDDVCQIDPTEYQEKSNRLCWFCQLIYVLVFENSKNLSPFWKDYEEYCTET